MPLCGFSFCLFFPPSLVNGKGVSRESYVSEYRSCLHFPTSSNSCRENLRDRLKGHIGLLCYQNKHESPNSAFLMEDRLRKRPQQQAVSCLIVCHSLCSSQSGLRITQPSVLTLFLPLLRTKICCVKACEQLGMFYTEAPEDQPSYTEVTQAEG